MTHCPPRRSALALIAIAVLVAVVVPGSVARAGDLDPQQAKTLATLASYAKQIETNVRLAADGVGPGEGKPSDAKVRLARTRLAQPKATLISVREAIDKLPQDNADVAALRKRLDESAAAITALEDRLDGRSAGAPGAPAPTGPAAPTVRLDYKQQKALSDGDFHVRRVAGIAADLVELVRRNEAVAEKDSIDHRLVRAGMTSVEFARKTAVNARNHLDPLPPDGEGVAAVVELLASSLASIAASELALAPLDKRLATLVDPKSYPTLDADVRRMRELAGMYRDSDVLTRDPRRAAQLVGEARAAKSSYEALVKAYAAFLLQATEGGKPIDAALRHFRETFAAFELAVDQRSETLSGSIAAAVAEVNGMADAAIAEKKPAFFVHAIPERVRALDDMAALAAALDADEGKRAASTVEALRAGLTAKQASLADAIVEANELPADRYAGGDRSDLERAAVAAWKALEPGADVLASRIPSEAWRRETMWRHQNASWYRIDRSTIQVQLLVKQDDRLAVLRPIDLWIDHQNGDERKAFPFQTPKDAVTPQFLMLRTRIK